MRKPILLSALAILAGIAVLVMVPHAQEQSDPLRVALNDEQFQQFGIEKLSSSEQQNLLMHILTMGPTISYTQSAAERYLEKQGWRRVRVLGATPPPDGTSDLRVVVWDHYNVLLLDPFGSPQLPDPGIHWARNSLSSWDLLYPDGEKVNFTAR